MSSPIEQAPAPNEATPGSAFQCWQQGYGVIRHSEQTSARVRELAGKLVSAGHQPDEDTVYRKLIALDAALRPTQSAVRGRVHRGHL